MTVAVVPKIVKGQVIGTFRLVRIPDHLAVASNGVGQLDIARGLLVGCGLSFALWAVILHSII